MNAQITAKKIENMKNQINMTQNTLKSGKSYPTMHAPSFRFLESRRCGRRTRCAPGDVTKIAECAPGVITKNG